MHSIITAIVLSLNMWPVPPPAKLPGQLEDCIGKAEQCADEAGNEAGPAMEGCISSYEDCSYKFDEAHESSCQIVRVWCALEPQKDQAWIDFCIEVSKTCPA